MSATPEVPLLAAAKEAGVKIRMIKRNTLRKARRFYVRGPISVNLSRIPARTIVFSTGMPK